MIKYCEKYTKPKWAVKQLWRASGLLEDICEHGVGHPNKEFLDKNPKYAKDGFGIHGCDGCCVHGKRGWSK